MPDEKPFEPTYSRIQRAKREGNIARSQELITVFSFGTGAVVTFAVLPVVAALGRTWLGRTAGAPGTFSNDIAATMGMVALLPLVATAVAGTVCGAVQGGGLQFHPPTIKPERMNPAENLKRMFASEAAVAAARAVLAFVVASAFFIPTANLVFNRVSGGGSLQALGSIASLGAQRGIASALAVASFFAVADFLLVRKRWLKKLRMSLYDLKKELAENEGNPQLRGRRRQRHRALASGALAQVRNASFVVANPTHVAVALEYRPPEVPVPRVLVKAVEDVALRVRAHAAELGIPIIEDVALARTLYATSRVGKNIPHETFIAVAEIVMALSKMRRTA